LIIKRLASHEALAELTYLALLGLAHGLAYRQHHRSVARSTIGLFHRVYVLSAAQAPAHNTVQSVVPTSYCRAWVPCTPIMASQRRARYFCEPCCGAFHVISIEFRTIVAAGEQKKDPLRKDNAVKEKNEQLSQTTRQHPKEYGKINLFFPTVISCSTLTQRDGHPLLPPTGPVAESHLAYESMQLSMNS
jgi:hypothetical protein